MDDEALDAIEARAANPSVSYYTLAIHDVPALVAEVRRLRAELDDARVTIRASVGQYEPPPDHAGEAFIEYRSVTEGRNLIHWRGVPAHITGPDCPCQPSDHPQDGSVLDPDGAALVIDTQTGRRD